jgi:hypothetical protein
VKGELLSQPLDALANSTGTTSLIVIHQDKVAYEKYFGGYEADSVNTSFSTVKSIVSLMIGIAIEDGFIESEEQPISDYISELSGTEFADITIQELLMMRSKIEYQQGTLLNLWFADGAKTYYSPDLRDLALNSLRVDTDYGGEFHYNNYHPLLLGIILERSTGMSVSEYFRLKIWDKVGAENNASWSLDSDQSGFEKMESGLNFKSIDFAKIGSMLINRGNWNGNAIIDEKWLNRSIVAAEPKGAVSFEPVEPARNRVVRPSMNGEAGPDRVGAGEPRLRDRPRLARSPKAEQPAEACGQQRRKGFRTDCSLERCASPVGQGWCERKVHAEADHDPVAAPLQQDSRDLLAKNYQVVRPFEDYRLRGCRRVDRFGKREAGSERQTVRRWIADAQAHQCASKEIARCRNPGAALAAFAGILGQGD